VVKLNIKSSKKCNFIRRSLIIELILVATVDSSTNGEGSLRITIKSLDRNRRDRNRRDRNRRDRNRRDRNRRDCRNESVPT